MSERETETETVRGINRDRDRETERDKNRERDKQRVRGKKEERGEVKKNNLTVTQFPFILTSDKLEHVYQILSRPFKLNPLRILIP